jgi:hypothetical protein
VENPLRLIFSDGWRMIEATGTWMNAPTAKLRFQTSYEEGREVTVLIRLSNSPWVSDQNLLRVDVTTPSGAGSQSGFSQRLRPSVFFWCRTRGRVGPNGILSLRLAVSGPIVADPGSIPVAVRLHTLGYYAADDTPARLDLLETIFMVDE